jgi:hypothetical protein
MALGLLASGLRLVQAFHGLAFARGGPAPQPQAGREAAQQDQQ